MTTRVFVLGLLLAGGTACAAPRGVNDLFVAPDSPVVRAVYAQPVTGDLFELQVAREILSIARDWRGQRALDAYLADAAVGALAGTARTPAGTIARVVEAPPAPVVAAARDILATTLAPRLATSRDAPEPPYRSEHLEQRELAPGLWGTYREGRLDSVSVTIRVESRRRGVARWDTYLEIQQSGRSRLRIHCRASPAMPRPLDAGESWPHLCFTGGGGIDVAALAAAVRQVAQDPTRWTLKPDRIDFVDPRVSVTANRVAWLDRGRAREQAIDRLLAADCRMRASCMRELENYFARHPEFGVGAAGVAAGLVVGTLIAVFARRRLRWAVIVTLAGAALAIAAIAAIATSAARTGSGWGILGAIALAFLAAVVLATFVAGLVVALGIAALLRRRAA